MRLRCALGDALLGGIVSGGLVGRAAGPWTILGVESRTIIFRGAQLVLNTIVTSVRRHAYTSWARSATMGWVKALPKLSNRGGENCLHKQVFACTKGVVHVAYEGPVQSRSTAKLCWRVPELTTCRTCRCDTNKLPPLPCKVIRLLTYLSSFIRQRRRGTYGLCIELAVRHAVYMVHAVHTAVQVSA